MAEINSNSIDKTSVYVSAGLISACGALMFNVLPVFVGALSQAYDFSESQLGDVIAYFNVAFTLVAISALFWIRKVNWQWVSWAGLATSIVPFVMMTKADSYASILILTSIIGLGMGTLYALVMAVLSDSQCPDRAFGLKLGLETIPGALCLFLLPAFVFPNFGLQGVLLSLALVLCVLGMSTFYLPARSDKSDDSLEIKAQSANPTKPVATFNTTVLSILALLSSLFFFTGIVATWAFLELLADAKGISASQVGQVLSAGFVICGVGGFIAALIGTKWGRLLPFTAIVFISLVGLWNLSIFNDLLGYAIGACLFLFSVNFTLAYTFGLTAEVDKSGTLIVLSAAMLSIGAIIGPFFSGRIVERAGYDGMLTFSAASIVIAAMIYLFVLYRLQNAKKA